MAPIRMRRWKGVLCGAAFAATLLTVSHAWSDDRIPVTKIEFEDNANGKRFPRPEAACQDYERETAPGSKPAGLDDYHEGDPSVRCLWTTAEGDKDGFTGVTVRETCPVHSNAFVTDVLKTKQCACDSGFVPKNGACAPAEEQQAQASETQGAQNQGDVSGQDAASAGSSTGSADASKDQPDCKQDPSFQSSSLPVRAREIRDAIAAAARKAGNGDAATMAATQGNAAVARVCIAGEWHTYLGIRVATGDFRTVDANTGEKIEFFDPDAVAKWARKNIVRSGEEFTSVVIDPKHAEDAVREEIQLRAHEAKVDPKRVIGNIAAASPICVDRCQRSLTADLPRVSMVNPKPAP